MIFYYKIVTVTIVLITILRNDVGKRIGQTRPGKNLNFYFKCPFCPQFIQTFNPFPLSLSLAIMQSLSFKILRTVS